MTTPTARERAEKLAEQFVVAAYDKYRAPEQLFRELVVNSVLGTIEAAEQAAREAEREACAKIAERAFGGPAHTYASENADLYRAQDGACERIASLIRARNTTETPT